MLVSVCLSGFWYRRTASIKRQQVPPASAVAITQGNTLQRSPIDSRMKFFIVLLALAAVVAADHEGHEHHDHHEGHDHHDHGSDYVVKTHDDLVSYRSKCQAKLDIPADHIEKYKKWEFPDDEKTHCYMKCIFEEFGLFDETHGFDVHKIHHQLAGKDGHVDHSDETHTKIENCADKNTEGSDACTWAYRGGMCFFKENIRLVQHSVETH